MLSGEIGRAHSNYKMENLAQIESIQQKIKMTSTTTVKALHKCIFEEEGDRRNRQRLREFQGFSRRNSGIYKQARIWTRVDDR